MQCLGTHNYRPGETLCKKAWGVVSPLQQPPVLCNEKAGLWQQQERSCSWTGDFPAPWRENQEQNKVKNWQTIWWTSSKLKKSMEPLNMSPQKFQPVQRNSDTKKTKDWVKDYELIPSGKTLQETVLNIGEETMQVTEGIWQPERCYSQQLNFH